MAAYAEFNALIARAVYTPGDRARMIDLLLSLEVYRRVGGVVRPNRTTTPRWAWLRANRGAFDVERSTTGIEIVAGGRGAWIGWLELAIEPVDEVSTRMTGRVIGDVAADVLAVIEAEHRPSLVRFNDELLTGRYGRSMLIDGNDTRGIDVGLMTVDQVEILAMRSNVDEPDPEEIGEKLYSRDCPEYQCRLPSGAVVWVLLNHFKSQSGGGGGAKRARQARGVRAIVDRLVAAGERHIVVMGDLNEGPTAAGQAPPNLGPLFDAAGPLVDAYSLPGFDVGSRPGTFQTCTLRHRFDYILVSRELAARFVGGGVERRGLWGDPTSGSPPTHWAIYPDITGAEHAASDHAAVFIDLDL